MTRELVFLHGRSQQNKNSVELKAQWIDALESGLDAAGLKMPISETAVRFPYYGDTLMQLIDPPADGQIDEILIRGMTDDDETARAFVEEFVAEVRDQRQIAPVEDAAIEAVTAVAVARGWQNSRWVMAILRALDSNVPFTRGAALALATNDVYHYLYNKRVSKPIDDGVRAAMTPGVESVVVAHSLGSIVAYKLLTEQGRAAEWKVPTLVTVGSPLGVHAVTKKLGTIAYPSVVDSWFNARDPEDIVALNALEAPYFDVQPAIVNKSDVANGTSNQHGISGYLSDPEVARVIHDALLAG